MQSAQSALKQNSPPNEDREASSASVYLLELYVGLLVSRLQKTNVTGSERATLRGEIRSDPPKHIIIIPRLHQRSEQTPNVSWG